MKREEVQEAWVKIVDTGFGDYTNLTRDQRVWFNIEPLTTDGVIDHYINHGAEHNADTIDDLMLLGQADVAGLLQEINRLFKDGQPPTDIEERNNEIVGWNGRYDALLDDINDRYWQLNDSLEKSLMNHIIKTNIGTV